jgi:acylphosphatase
MKRITASVTGNVQGVGYRYYITDCACEVGVTGYAKNLPDGSVEVIAEGIESDLEEFILELKADNDPVIRVQNISVAWENPTGEYDDFCIIL